MNHAELTIRKEELEIQLNDLARTFKQEMKAGKYDDADITRDAYQAAKARIAKVESLMKG